MHKRKLIGRFLLISMAALALALAATPQAVTAGAADVSSAPVYWSWDLGGEVVGGSHLVRTEEGISANLRTTGLNPGHTMTLWFVVFNHPDQCSPPGCGPDDMGDTPAKGDFLFAGGSVVGGSGKAAFGGYLAEGEVSGSGLGEVVCPETLDCTPGLIDAKKALIVLAVHSHGPAQSGQVLQEQISSFTGGCVFPDTFLGPDGIADGPEDVPTDEDVGYCSTFQMSPHPPPAP